jgi:hypothetical protein
MAGDAVVVRVRAPIPEVYRRVRSSKLPPPMEEMTMLRQAAEAAFRKFTGDLEGKDVPFMYLDDHKPDPLVTCGNGNLIDPISEALKLRWLHKATGIVATNNEIAAAWRTVKARTDLAPRGGMSFEDVTDLILDQAAIDLLYETRLRSNEDFLRQIFHYFGKIPCDGQMAIMSMTWAMGAGRFHEFPKFVRAVNAFDFDAAALECHMSDGAELRNAADRLMLENASSVMKHGLDPEELWWPRTASAVTYSDTELVVPKDPDDVG